MVIRPFSIPMPSCNPMLNSQVYCLSRLNKYSALLSLPLKRNANHKVYFCYSFQVASRINHLWRKCINNIQLCKCFSLSDRNTYVLGALLQQDVHHRSQAVGSAGGIGHHVVVGLVVLSVVHSANLRAPNRNQQLTKKKTCSMYIYIYISYNAFNPTSSHIFASRKPGSSNHPCQGRR